MTNIPTRDVLGIFSEDDLAAALNVRPSTLQVWRVEGYGPPWVKLGKSVFYRFQDVREWISTNVQQPKLYSPPIRIISGETA